MRFGWRFLDSIGPTTRHLNARPDFKHSPIRRKSENTAFISSCFSPGGDPINKVAQFLAYILASICIQTSASNAATFLGIDLADDAFADTVLSDVSGHTVWNTLSAVAALTGSYADSTAFNTTLGTFVTIGFVDNLVRNGACFDLIAFERDVEAAENIVATIDGIQSSPTPQTSTGFFNSDGYEVFYSAFDLTDFGIADGGTIDAAAFQGECTTSACTGFGLASSAFVAFAAVNSASVAPIPLPSTFPLLILGLGGLDLAARSASKSGRC